MQNGKYFFFTKWKTQWPKTMSGTHQFEHFVCCVSTTEMQCLSVNYSPAYIPKYSRTILFQGRCTLISQQTKKCVVPFVINQTLSVSGFVKCVAIDIST